MNINQLVDSMKKMSDLIYGYSLPGRSVSPLLTRYLTVDGYDLTVFYSKTISGRGDDLYNLETFQCSSRYYPFLPFDLVKKLACLFLGDEQLSLAEQFTEHGRIYCWYLFKESDNQKISYPYENADLINYDGWNYSLIRSNSVNFY